jgi:hypothetical protein
MRVRTGSIAMVVALICAPLMTAGAAARAHAADSPAASRNKGILLYEDQNTGALYRKPGKGRVAVRLSAEDEDNTQEIEQQVQKKTEQELKQHDNALRAEFLHKQDQLIKENAELAQRVQNIEPAWRAYLQDFQRKYRIGVLLYADWGFYTHSGFGPQFQDNLNQLGPGNNIYNSFDVTRAYLQFFYYPTDDLLVRITPDIYKTFGSASAGTFGKNTAVASNLSGNLNYRLKYAYVQYRSAFDWSRNLKGDTISAGLIQQPFLPWEEDLYGYRFVNASPWNYAGLSTSYFGLSVQGPIKYNELQYVDYDFGIYTNAKYSQYEQSNTKQAMGRVSVYPLGARWRFDGLGLTFGYDYGWGNVPPDATGPGGFGSKPTTLTGGSNAAFAHFNPATAFGNAAQAHITRLAALAHYTGDRWQLAVEYDYGHNAFNGSSLFSGSGPAEFFSPTAPRVDASPSPQVDCTSSGAISGRCSAVFAPYHNFSTLVAALQNNSRTVQSGFDVFGHYKIAHTPLTLFGMFQWFQPNTKVDLNPLDFQRWIAGVSYQYNEYMRIALNTQNLLFYHDQFPFQTRYANSFAPVFPSARTPKGHAPPNHTYFPEFVGHSVPRDTHAIFVNLEFSY